MARKVWFQLVDATSRGAFANTQTTSVSSDGVNDIDDLRMAVWDHVKAILPSNVIAANLRIYTDRAAYDAKENTLEEDLPISTLGGSKKKALIVEVPTQRVDPRTVTSEAKPNAIPSTTVLNEPDKYAEECLSLTEWCVGAVHEIPSIWGFMNNFGGCTNSGKIFWRMEDKQIASLLLDGWFRASTPSSINPRANKKSIVIGSPGIGKSTLLCVMAFHLVFKHKKNVLVYRRLTKADTENCLLYLGYENGKVVQFAVQRCKSPDAITIYEELIRRQGVSKVWLLLDGFLYKDIPEGLRTFKMLATSQQADLKSQDRTDAYWCLLPCWSPEDLWLLGCLLFKFTDEEMEERFYYSGGSVRGFTYATVDEIRDEVDDAIGLVDDVSNLLSAKFSALTGISQVDRLRHTFVEDAKDARHFTSRRHLVQVVDSEYAVLGLSVGLKSDALLRIYTWAKGTRWKCFRGLSTSPCC